MTLSVPVIHGDIAGALDEKLVLPVARQVDDFHAFGGGIGLCPDLAAAELFSGD
jgi:hypothetical protein